MLDTLSYVKNQDDNNFIKTVTSVSTLDASDINDEIQVLQNMISNFEAGGLNDEINDAIANYQQQISILQAD